MKIVHRDVANTIAYAVMIEALYKGASIRMLVELSGVHENTARKLVSCLRKKPLLQQADKTFCPIVRWDADSLGRRGAAQQPVYRMGHGYDLPRPKVSEAYTRERNRLYAQVHHLRKKLADDRSQQLLDRIAELEHRMKGIPQK